MNSTYLFVTEPSGIKNLRNEGINKGVYLVGNVMMDTLLKNKKKAIGSGFIEKLSLDKSGYAVLPLHRPSNVDSKESFAKIMEIINLISNKIRVVFPMHPRAKKCAEKYNLNFDSVFTIGPLGYFDFLNLVINAKFVLTDSGGIQEETTCLGIPCLTLRDNTERPITTELGTNILCGRDKRKILDEVEKIMQGKPKTGKIPSYCDGKASQRIVKILAGNLN
jgi:UDP-N-acetylglucosamine 2-epimerase (non-hydrolysing)